MNLSEAELNALELLKGRGGEMLTSEIDAKNSRDVFGCIVPGMSVFRKLEKKGLVYFTVEDPVTLADGSEFTYTNSVCLVTET